jgi:hypothetical protein
VIDLYAGALRAALSRAALPPPAMPGAQPLHPWKRLQPVMAARKHACEGHAYGALVIEKEHLAN